MASRKVAIAVAKGDGIGPEIMDAALHIFEAAKVPLQYKFVEMGNKFYKNGFSTGVILYLNPFSDFLYFVDDP